MRQKNAIKTGAVMKLKFATMLLVALPGLLVAEAIRTNDRPLQEFHRFMPLGDLPGGIHSSLAHGVSADGSVVVGYSNSVRGEEAFRWTRRGGMVGLGLGRASAVSADGSVVVGFRHIGKGTEPVRWTQCGGPQGLGNLAGCECGAALGISAAGSVILGRCASNFGVRDTAFHWTPQSGISQLAPLTHGVVEVEAHAVSADGETFVGALRHESGRRSAFRWLASCGFLDLSAPIDGIGSIAYAVSDNGSVIVGLNVANDTAFRWTQVTGMLELGKLPGGRRSCAFGVSADGSTVVGQGDGESGMEAFVWDATHGMRSLRQLLMTDARLSANLRHWKLRSANAISPDGSTIVGNGINPNGDLEAWIAHISRDQSDGDPTVATNADRGHASRSATLTLGHLMDTKYSR
jgi:probable HAF family extracellular repeat protein